MATKPCYECGQECSTSAKACPNCGASHPASKGKRIGKAMQSVGCILTLLVTVPILFGMCVLVGA